MGNTPKWWVGHVKMVPSHKDAEQAYLQGAPVLPVAHPERNKVRARRGHQGASLCATAAGYKPDALC